MTELLVADLRTGRRILSLPLQTLTWEKAQNTADTLRASVKAGWAELQYLDLRNVTAPGKTLMAVIENDIVVAAGPIWRRVYRKGSGEVELTAAGMWSYFDHRIVMPLLAPDQGIIDPETGESGAWANTVLLNGSYGQQAKQLVQQARLWTGGDVPIVFQADEVGTYEDTILGANLTTVGQALRNIVDRASGVDIDFFARRTADRQGIEFVLRTGTLTEPQIHGLGQHRWDYSVPEPSVRNLVVDEDASDMTSQAWASGGRQDGSAVVERVTSDDLVLDGYPLLESVDSSHSEASEADTLVDYARASLNAGRRPAANMSFDVKAHGTPAVGQFWPGDFCELIVAGDPWLPDATYRREIQSIGGNELGEWISVTTVEVLNA